MSNSAAWGASELVRKCSKQGDLAAKKAAYKAEAQAHKAREDALERLAKEYKASGDSREEASAPRLSSIAQEKVAQAHDR